jgi:hypothetical protein
VSFSPLFSLYKCVQICTTAHRSRSTSR